MSELKTLQDFDTWNINKGDPQKMIDPEELKAEAVKIVKSIRQKRAGIVRFIDKIQWDFEVNNSLDQDIIKWFFNLTEEDLKEVQNEPNN